MVAIVAGGGLGLNLGSRAVLGGNGSFGSAGLGRYGPAVFVNASNGNLVVQARDDALAGRGPGATVLRTYNSQGQAVDDNGDNWAIGFARKVTLVGTLGSPGSTVVRRDEDGAEATFTWNAAAGLYTSTDGAGAHDTLSYSAGSGLWTYVEGSSRIVETYAQGAGGRLASVADASGNTLSFSYGGDGLLSAVTTAGGEITYYDYNPQHQLTQVRTVTRAAAGAAVDRTLTRVRYQYDASNRLQSVKVDLSPEDNSVADGRIFTTTYSYDGASTRVSGIETSDGAQLVLSYEQSGSAWRVKTVQDALGNRTSFTYDTASRQTTVRDALSQDSVFGYDTAGRLVSARVTLADGTSASTGYQYNASGDLERITDGEGRVVQMSYDTAGNVVRQSDSLGQVVLRTYNAANQLLTETVPAAGEPPAGTPAARHVYDAAGRPWLRFAITAEGRVTENRFDGQGQIVSTIRYAAAAYDLSALASSSVPSEAQLATWAAAQDRSRTERVDYQYDWRGQLSRSTSYSTVDAAGNGVADGSEGTTQYVYDAAGQLLSTITPRGSRTQYTYDGLGRVLSTTNALNQVTLGSWDDANRTVRTTAANGLVTVSTFDRAGRLVAASQSNASGAGLGTANSWYDGDGQLRMTRDATGASSWYFYDAAGRKVGSVDGTGALEEYAYDRSGRLTQTIAYATRVNTAPLVDAAGNVVLTSLAALRPGSTPSDRKSWNAYDAGGRLAKTVDAAGAVTEFGYDAAGRVISTRRYANTIATGALGSGPSAASIAPAASAADTLERRFYGFDGLLLATLDGAGGLVEYSYDAAGRTTTRLTHVTAADPAQQASGALTALRPADNAGDSRTLSFYDARGRVVAELDAAGYLTEKVYDADGNLAKLVRYPTAPAGASAASSPTALRGAAGAGSDQIAYSYDAINRVLTQRVDPNGQNLGTSYSYDDAANRLTTTDAAGVQTLTQFDLQGRATSVTVDPAGLNLRTSHSYDAAGRLIASTGPAGVTSSFAYDAAGRKVAELDGEGFLTEYGYDAFGQLVSSSRYAGKVPPGSRIRFESFDAGVPADFVANANGAPAADWARVVGGRIEITSGPTAGSQGWPLVMTSGRNYDLSGGMSVTYRSEVTLENANAHALVRAHGIFNGTGGFHDVQLFAGALIVHQYIGSNGQWQDLNYAIKVGVTYVVEQQITSAGSVIAVYEKGSDRSSGAVTRMDAAWTTVTDWLVHGDAYLGLTGTGRAFIDNFTETYGTPTDRSLLSTANLAAVRAAAGGAAQASTTRYVYDAAGRLRFEIDPAGQVLEHRYDAMGRLSATVVALARSQTDADAAPSTTPSQSIGFDSGPDGFYGAAGVWESGRLKLVSQPLSAGHSFEAAVDSRQLAPGTSVRMELTPTQMQNDLHAGVEATATSGGYERINVILKSDGTVMVQSLGRQGAGVWAALGRYIPGKTYVLEILTGKTDATVFLYEKGQSRASGSVYTLQDNFSWTGLHTIFWTRSYPDTPGVTTTYVDNIQYTAPSTAVEAYAYDGAGRKIAQLDAEGYLTEYSYDGAGRLSSSSRYANRVPSGSKIRFENFDAGPPADFIANQNLAPSADWARVANGRIEITSGPTSGAEGFPYVATTGRNYDLSGGETVTYRCEVTLDNAYGRAMVRGHGISSGAPVFHDVYLGVGGLSSFQYQAGTATPFDLHYAIKAGVTYVVEQRISSTGSEITVYEKGSDRSTGVFTRMDTPWQQATDWLVHGNAVSWFAGTGRAFIDNFTETYGGPNDRSLLSAANLAGVRGAAGGTAQALTTRYVYDAAGRLRFEIDPLGQVTEQRYDAKGRVSSTLRYERSLGLGSNPTEAQMVAATTVAQTATFETGMDGFSGSAGVVEGGRLKLVSQPLAGHTFDGVPDSRRFAPGTAVRMELTPTQIQYELHAGLEATATSGGYERINIVFWRDGLVYAQTYGTKGQNLLTALGAYVPGKTYVLEIATGKADATLYFYERGQDRASGYTHSIQDNFTWTELHTALWARCYPDTPGVTTTYVDNVQYASPAAAVESCAYDGAGRKIAQLDAEGYLTEFGYDGAGHLSSSTRYADRVPAGAKIRFENFDAGMPADFVANQNLAPSADWARVANGRIEITSGPAATQGWPYVATTGRNYDLSGGKTVTYRSEVRLENVYARAMVRAHGTRNGSNLAHDVYFSVGALGSTQYVAGTGTWTNLPYTIKAGVTYVVEQQINSAGSVITVYEKGSDRSSGIVTRMDGPWSTANDWLVHGDAVNWMAGSGRAFVDNFTETYGDANDRSLLSAANLAALRGVAGGAAQALSTRYIYDAAGRLRFDIDPSGGISENRYDADGQVVERVRHATSARSLTSFTLASVQALLTPAMRWTMSDAAVTHGTGAPAADGSWMADVNTPAGGLQWGPYTTTVRPGANRASWTISVDNNTLDDSALFTLDVYDHTSQQVLAQRTVTRSEFAAANRYQEFSLGFVLDAAAQGHPLEFRVWHLARARLQVKDVGVQADTRVTRNVYDADGRLAYAQDALGGVTQYRYDAFGRLVERIERALPVATSTALTLAAFQAAVTADATNDRRTRYVYDADGRLRFSVDALGGVVEHLYDAQGREARSIAYASTITYGTVTDATTPTGLRALLPASTLDARETVYTYDALGRVVHTLRSQRIDAGNKLFVASRNRYDGFGRVVETRQYANTLGLQDLPLVVDAAVLDNRLAAVRSEAYDRIQRYGYDAAGRLLTQADGEGNTERWVYDAFGNKVRYTNANGAVFDYAYDRAGRLVREIGPPVDVTTSSEPAPGAVPQATVSAAQRIETRLLYDAWGNLLSRTEAYGRAEQRSTRYAYDALGRQIRTSFESVGVYNAAADNRGANGITGAAMARTESAPGLVSETVYNAFGEAIANRDTSGNYSYKTYDALGRLVNEVDANHQVTHHAYATLGDAFSKLTRLAVTASFADGLGVSEATVDRAADAAGLAAAALAGGARSVRTSFDALGRTKLVEDLADGVYTFDSVTGQGGNWVRETRFTYDAWGGLGSRSVLLDRTAGPNRWATTRYFYDQLGQLAREVDAEGYVTDHWRNAFGEAWQVRQYATAIAAADATTMPPEVRPPANTNAPSYDRITEYHFDRRGKVVSDEKLFIQFGRLGADGRFTAASGRLMSWYAYDGVGNLLSTTQAVMEDGSSTSTVLSRSFQSYDLLGRVRTSQQAVDAADNAQRRTTSFEYDALGNATRSTRYANLSSNGTAVPTADAANDQTTVNVYDKLGRVLVTQDAGGWRHYFSYDAAGRVAKQWTPVNDVRGTQLQAAQVFNYDKAGRQTETLTLVQSAGLTFNTYGGASWTSESVAYNAFGEITARWLDGRQTAYYDYDAGGRVWRTNAEDGVDKVFLYDLQDNVSMVLMHATTDLHAAYASAAAVQTNEAGTRRITKTYDKLQHLRTLATASVAADGSVSTATQAQQVDRWGNVLQATTALGYTTSYRYDQNNQVVEERLPVVSYYTDYQRVVRPSDGVVTTDQAGTLVTGTPVTKVYYDALGRKLGQFDARNNTNRAEYRFTGEIAREIHADGGQVTFSYDNFGREIVRTSADANASPTGNGKVTKTSWDQLNRKKCETVSGRLLVHTNDADTSAGSFVFALGERQTAAWSYDALGHRITETTGEDDTVSGVVRSYSYDSAGRIAWTRSEDTGRTTSYSYDGAGRKTGETDPLGHGASWSYDAQGRLTGHVDIGGATTSYSYDRAGQLVRQTSTRGQDIRTSYDGFGRTTKIEDIWNGSTSTYSYDADGRKITDSFVLGSVVYRNVSMGYDALGRMTSVSDDAYGTGSLPAYSLAIDYDANGNRYRVHGSATDDDYIVDRSTGNKEDLDGASTPFELTYTYDAMNRVVDTRKASIVVSGGMPTTVFSWTHFGYDYDGERTSEEQRTADGAPAGTKAGTLVEYSYDFAGRLAKTMVTGETSNGAGGLTRSTAKAHRFVVYSTAQGASWAQEWQWADSTAKDSFSFADVTPDRVLITETWRNVDNVVTQAFGRSQRLGGTRYDTSSQINQLDAAGNLVRMQSIAYQDQSTDQYYSRNYTYDYLEMDGYLQRKATVTGYELNSAGQWLAVDPASTTSDYDVNGHLLQSYGVNVANNSASQYLVTDAAGHIVTKIRFTASTPLGTHKDSKIYYAASGGTEVQTGATAAPVRPVRPDFLPMADQRTNIQTLRFANDQQIGSSDEVRKSVRVVILPAGDLAADPAEPPPPAAKGAASQSAGAGDPSLINGAQYYNVTQLQVTTSLGEVFGPSAVADTGVVATQYSWNSGDTLKALAQRFYGDANLWYVIAQANGLDNDSAAIAAGTMLNIPNVTRWSNTSQTYGVYNASRVVSDTNPEPVRPPPPPPPKDGCGGIGTILVVAVAVVATIYTAGAASTLMTSGTLGGIGTTMSAGMAALGGGAGLSAATVGAAAIGGAMGSIAGQGVAMAMGMQENFSWKQVGLSAIGSAVSSALPASFGSVAGGTGSAGQVAVRAAMSNALTQGVGVAVGLQDRFDWRSVAASAAAAPAAQFVSSQLQTGMDKLFDGNALGIRTATGIVNGVVGQRVRMIVTGRGRIDYASIAADAFGNALGQDIVDTVSARQRERDLQAREDARDAEMSRLVRGDGRSAGPAASATFNQLVSAFGNPPPPIDDSDPTVLAAAGSGLSGLSREASSVSGSGLKIDPSKLSRFWTSETFEPRYAPSLGLKEVGDYFSGFGSGFKNDFSLSGVVKSVSGFVSGLVTDFGGTLESGGLAMQDRIRQLFRAGRSGDFTTAGRIEGRIAGEQAAGFVLGVGVGQGIRLGAAAFGTAGGIASDLISSSLAPYTSVRLGERLSFVPSSGVNLVSTPWSTTTILGNFGQDMRHIVGELGNVKSVDFGPRPGGFNVLNVPDALYRTPKQFWSDYNGPWLSNAVERGDRILMATEPVFGRESKLFRLNQATNKLELSGFGKEYLSLRRQRLVYDPVTKQMVRR